MVNFWRSEPRKPDLGAFWSLPGKTLVELRAKRQERLEHLRARASLFSLYLEKIIILQSGPAEGEENSHNRMSKTRMWTCPQDQTIDRLVDTTRNSKS